MDLRLDACQASVSSGQEAVSEPIEAEVLEGLAPGRGCSCSEAFQAGSSATTGSFETLYQDRVWKDLHLAKGCSGTETFQAWVEWADKHFRKLLEHRLCKVLHLAKD